MADGRLERARAASGAIEGWLTDSEGELLFRLAASNPPGARIVEIGSWKGKSTLWLAAGADGSGSSIFAIDPHKGSLENAGARTLDELRANIERSGMGAHVVPIVAASHDVAPTFDQPLGLVFIDGNHLEDAVAQDLGDWLPKLVEGGVVALHDVLNHRWPGPRRALRRLLWRSKRLTAARFVDSIAWMRRVPRNSVADRMRNRLTAVLLLLYELRVHQLPAPVASFLRFVYRHTPLKRPHKRSTRASA